MEQVAMAICSGEMVGNRIDHGVPTQRWQGDEHYLDVLGMNIVEGRGFKDMVSDSASIVINQTLAGQLGLKEPLGQKIINHNMAWNVIGVVEDFHYENYEK